MKCIAVLSYAAFAAIAVAGQAVAEPCLSPSQVQGWTTSDQRNEIVVRATGGRRYTLSLSGQCPGLNTILALRVSSHGVGICVAPGDYVTYRYHQFGEERCLITAVTPNDPARNEDEPQSSGN